MKNNIVRPFTQGIIYGAKISWAIMLMRFRAAPVTTTLYYASFAALGGYSVYIGMNNSWWYGLGLYMIAGTALNICWMLGLKRFIGK